MKESMFPNREIFDFTESHEEKIIDGLSHWQFLKRSTSLKDLMYGRNKLDKTTVGSTRPFGSCFEFPFIIMSSGPISEDGVLLFAAATDLRFS